MVDIEVIEDIMIEEEIGDIEMKERIEEVKNILIMMTPIIRLLMIGNWFHTMIYFD